MKELPAMVAFIDDFMRNNDFFRGRKEGERRYGSGEELIPQVMNLTAAKEGRKKYHWWRQERFPGKSF